MRWLVSLLLLIGASWTLADEGSAARLARLEMALVGLQREQQSVYQQFQMAQELRRGEMQAVYQPSVGTRSAAASGMETLPAIDYDENVRQQRERQERIRQSNRDLNALYARHAELAEQRKALLDQILELAIHAKD